MKLEMDTRFVSGSNKGKMISPQVAESALMAMREVTKKFEGKDKNIVECIGNICLQFSGDIGGSNTSMRADIVVFLPGANGVRTAKIVTCKAKFEFDKGRPTDEFAEKILESVVMTARLSSLSNKQPVAA